MISVLILTLNEEVNLPRCLEAVAWSDDIVVLDSGSTDRTVAIAEAAGARVVTRPFDNELNQRLFSLREIDFKYAWVYNPDADEIPTLELRDEMLAVTADESRSEVAYRARFKTVFMDKWIRYSSLYPTWVMRLFKPATIRMERLINLSFQAEGPVGLLDGHFMHYTFSRGLAAWREKHRRYAESEARELVKAVEDRPIDWRGILTRGDPVRRRRALKELSFRLPLRPLARFCYCCFVRRGFLDGWPGIRYCSLISWYEQEIDVHARRLRRQARRERRSSATAD